MIWIDFGQTWLRLFVELSLLYLGISFAADLLLTHLPASRIRRLLQGRRTFWAMGIAVALGAVTPFCSCSTVPVVAGMRRAGVPFPPLATFLVMSPLVNPAIVALLVTWAGFRYAVLFVLACAALSLAVGGFFAVARFSGASGLSQAAMEIKQAPPANRMRFASSTAWRSWTRILPTFVLATGIGTILLTLVPTGIVTGLVSGTEWWRIPLAAIVGIPVYASTGVLLPLGTVLFAGGANVGVVTAFIVGATGFSIPEAILLKKLIGTRALVMFGSAFAVGVIGLGYSFQAMQVVLD